MRRLGVVTVAGHDDHPPSHPQHVHAMAVEAAEHIRAHHLIGRAGGGATVCQIHDAVHHRQQRVHLVRRDQHRYLLLVRDPAEQVHDLACAAQIEVRQRLVEQQQPRPADQRVRDQDALLLAAGETPDAGVGKLLGVDRGEHLLDELAPCATGARQAQTMAVDAERDEVSSAQRHVGVEQELLWHVAELLRRCADGRRRSTLPLLG